ncbi:cytochrome-c peroxidase [Chitinophaga nivalis]|uniref:Cytochrome c domain-containing protein n=1 Tax=Chitinophaga nivalis TaxID=2991709 RepID=A0ABT3IM78_9BACT|nr:cytochrome c peroxidase [Chitinophaga nivalis]MCW3465238.1 hypothetical protein [Chitinophaga nivalis]MCW3485070.1 hypothetical protein [Chitinophaga nivalis]
MKRPLSKRTCTSLLLLAGMILLYIPACKKDQEATPGTSTPTPAPGGDPGQIPADHTPQLPAVLYNYVHTGQEMPPYLQQFLRNNPDIDNTPDDNPITNTGATLGRVLFYDKLLSVNNKTACASCHHQDKAFTDGVAFSEGFDGRLTRRNSMSLVNVRFFKDKNMFWDMRAANLETQTLMPILDHLEMGMPDLPALEQKLGATTYYPGLFRAAFGSPAVTADKISRALSQFLRSIVSFRSAYDEGVANNFAAFTAEENRGRRLLSVNFCTECHSDLANATFGQTPSYLIVDNSGRNRGFGSNNGLETNYTDKGIGEITHLPEDQGTFKIPSLRNVELTAPYMHDGRFATLDATLEHYSTGVKQNPNIGIQLGGLSSGGIHLSAQDKKDIIAFLKTLTDHQMTKDPRYANPFKD